MTTFANVIAIVFIFCKIKTRFINIGMPKMVCNEIFLYFSQYRKEGYIIMTDKEQLYFDALQEIAERLGHSIEHPISVSLLCLQLGISNDEKGRIFVAFNQVLRKNAPKELEVEKFKIALEDVNPKFGEFNDKVVCGLIKAFSLHYIPSLYSFARTLN